MRKTTKNLTPIQETPILERYECHKMTKYILR